ncbi:ACT domain-containing protein [Pseudoalteromonas luteoviolacea]|uniref:ACT domain-containing protein n=1 Tax=Pseudoalteromonas luteoviolacea TaxID=43657 RepID=UPI001B3A40F8|nr:ACT domain-containing protein [Pseudoalteromonas luteoviolacea]MBQ4877482.1 ACT domain-containing protein [Pseudoalteromonas luteoviolacea]MBQ4906419.1 ACT domain-containing protein [Pseudoalteromonas luteoviolacea]
MSGETNLSVLLASMEPVLSTQLYVYCVVSERQLAHLSLSKIHGMFREKEGVTVIISKAYVQEADINYQGDYRCITLNVHSSLEAVGLTAAFAAALGEEGLSANVVAGYYHDHIFVQNECADKALQCLIKLSQSHQGA